MAGLLLGIDLCNDYSQMSCFNLNAMDALPITMGGDEKNCLIPTVLCKKKGADTWFIGEEAYRYALIGEGIMVDKLIGLTAKSGTATIEGKKYEAEELLELFIGKLLMLAFETQQGDSIEKVVYTIQQLDPVVMDCLVRVSDALGIARSKVHIISHTESYLYYVISQQKEVWLNQTSLFDLTEFGLHYYELKVIRGRTPQIVEVTHEALEEGFSLEILESSSGKHMADTILCSCGERLLGRKIISSVFLTGRGFEESSWAEGFLKLVCNKRKVFAGQNLFAKGAAYVAFDNTQEESSYPYVCICEGRIRNTVAIEAMYQGRKRQFIVAGAGTNWYEAKTSLEFIVDGCDTIDFLVQSVDTRAVKRVSLSLADFPVRPPKTTRIEVIVAFIKEDCMMVRVIDKGFGELFPASGQEVKQFFYLD